MGWDSQAKKVIDDGEAWRGEERRGEVSITLWVD